MMDNNEPKLPLIKKINKSDETLKESIHEIKKAKETAETYLNLAGVILIAINVKGDITLVNKKGCEIIGYKRKEIIGKNWFTNFIPKRLRKKTFDYFKELISNRIKPVEYHENPVFTKCGEERLIAWHDILLKDDRGKITGRFSSGEDITERKKLEKMKDSLTHIIMHDLNNLLFAITGHLQLLKMDLEKSLSDEHRDSIRIVLRSSHEMKDMIANLLDISKMEEGKLLLDCKKIDLKSVINEIMESHNIIARQHKKKIITRISSNVQRISADKNILKRIISNLINNALKSTPEESEIKVNVKYNHNEKNILISITDHGPSIQKKYQEHIFDKFAQIQDNTVRGFGVKGLGLTFCKMAVEAHGGKIWVESKKHQGSTFYFTLPV